MSARTTESHNGDQKRSARRPEGPAHARKGSARARPSSAR